MIDLTPIDKRIQKKLFEKMKLHGREGHTPGTTVNVSGLTNNQVKIRTPFIRMTSGLEVPVILMGGELTSDTTDSEGNMTLLGNTGRLAAGYDEIYGPRSYYDPDDFFQENDLGQNKFKRPMPGIKSADIVFKGGSRALREGTVSWTCWSFEDLNRLMPHFLSHGGEVLLEWGWVYGNDTLKNLPTFYDFIEDKKIKRDAYTNYQQEIIDANGDFDMLLGIVKNFEFTTRDDGAFDCQTILTSVGINIFDSTIPNKNTSNSGIYYDIKKTEDLAELKQKVRAAKKDTEKLIDLDTSSTLHTFLTHFDDYLLDYIYDTIGKGKRGAKILESIPKVAIEQDWELNLKTGKGPGKKEQVIKRTNINLSYVPNEFVLEYDYDIKNQNNSKVKDAWVRWGWFEDNILSKFINLVSDEAGNPPILEFRSVENILNEEGKETSATESTKIRNHPELETINLNNYILPGKFSGFQPKKKYKIINTDIMVGDTDRIMELAKMVNNNFKPFDIKSTESSGVVIVDQNYVAARVGVEKVNMTGPNGEKIQKNSKGQSYYIPETSNSGDIEDEKYGYFRSMLINTKTIRSAFGISEEKDENVRFINMRESIENLFELLNQDLNLWDFELETDSIHSNRVKIVDTNTVNFKFKNNVRINDTLEQTPSTKSIYDTTNEEVKNNGVFFFPVWQADSIVKRQNLTANVPNAMALSIMYGANYDEVSTLNDPPPEAQEVEAVAVASFFKDFFETNKNLNKKNFSIALRNKTYEKFGTDSSTDADRQNLSNDGGKHNIRNWLRNNKDKVQTVYDDKIEVITSQIRSVDKNLMEFTELDLSVALSTPEILEKEQPRKFKKLLEGFFVDGKQRAGGLERILNSKYRDNNRMKQNYIDKISLVTGTSVSTKYISDSSKPLILPMELELDIDGIGGIYPSNSFHSTYLTQRYQEETVFQIFDVNHKLDSAGWTVTLNGKMRSTLGKIVKNEVLLELEDELNDLRQGQRNTVSQQIQDEGGGYYSPKPKNAKNSKRYNLLENLPSSPRG